MRLGSRPPTATSGETQNPRSEVVRVRPTTSSAASTKVRIAVWRGTATESYVQYAIGQEPGWRVHFVSSTSCTDATSSAVGTGCSLKGDAYFHIVTHKVNNKTVKTCDALTNFNGDNAFTTFTPSTAAYSLNGNGSGYLSGAYDDDQSLPVHTVAHFHFETTNNFGTGGVDAFTGHGVGLRACANSSASVAGVVTTTAG